MLEYIMHLWKKNCGSNVLEYISNKDQSRIDLSTVLTMLVSVLAGRRNDRHGYKLVT